MNSSRNWLLFEHMQDEHGRSLLESEMEEIRDICRRLEDRDKYEAELDRLDTLHAKLPEVQKEP